MTCPNCGYTDLRAVRQDGIIRSYHCYRCGFGFETVEVVREVERRQVFQAAMFRAMNGKAEEQGR